MKIKPRTIKHEKFKEMVKEWLDTHREEYCAFAEEVSRRDRSGFIQIFEYAQLAAPGYASAVMAKMSEKDPKDLDSIEQFLRDADIASTLVDDFQSRIRTPLFRLCWHGCISATAGRLWCHTTRR